MFPMDRKPTPVSIEYTSRNRRVVKTFPNAYAAKRFYVIKDRAGMNPQVVSQQHKASNMTKKSTTTKAKPATKKSTTTKATKVIASTNGKAKPTKPATKDQWGGRLGTGVADINAAISSKPISVIDLAKKLNRPVSPVRSHIYTLLKKKKVIVMDKDGLVSIKK